MIKKKVLISSSFLIINMFIITVIMTSCSGKHTTTEADPNAPVNHINNRIISYHDQQFISFSEMINNLLQSDIIFIGEKHDNQESHQLEWQILNSLYYKNNQLILALEMFDRDVQPFLDKYIYNRISEKIFLIHSRPWSNYKSDYGPLIEFAKANRIKVLAMNAPRQILRKLVQFGKKILDTLSPDEKQYLSEKANFSDPVYQKYFYDSLPKNHPMRAKFKQRLLHAAILKDDTMAESIVQILKQPKYLGYKVIVVNGMFHSNYGLAIPKRIKNKNPDLKIKIISLIPLTKNNKAINPKPYLSSPKIADYIIFTN